MRERRQIGKGEGEDEESGGGVCLTCVGQERRGGPGRLQRVNSDTVYTGGPALSQHLYPLSPSRPPTPRRRRRDDDGGQGGGRCHPTRAAADLQTLAKVGQTCTSGAVGMDGLG